MNDIKMAEASFGNVNHLSKTEYLDCSCEVRP